MGSKQTNLRSTETNNYQVNHIEHKSDLVNNVNDKPVLPQVSNTVVDLSSIDNDAFSPVVCRQRQKTIENMVYRETIEKWQPSSFDELVNFIQELSVDKNQIDRAWIIYYWITQNIDYDVDAFLNQQIGTQNALNVFQTRKALCEGYSSLYYELCHRTGIECDKIHGYGKGFGYDMRQRYFKKTNHVWNIIKLNNGHIYFVESTWGSGYVEKVTNTYRKKLISDYFLCQPEHMIYKHMPLIQEYQLLRNPISMKQFLMLPFVYPEFFLFNLHIISPVYSSRVELVENESYGLVLIQTRSDSIELSGLLEDDDSNKIEGGHLVYLDKDAVNLWRCQFAPPKPGKYNIFIFARNKNNQQRQSMAAVQFVFDVDYLPLPPISYPRIWSEFFGNDIEIIKPKNSRYIDWPSNSNTSYCKILVGSSNDIRMSASLRESLTGKHVNNGTFVNYDHHSNVWHCLFAPSSTDIPFELTLYARHMNEDKSHSVAEFILRPIPSHILLQPIIFPEVFLPFCNAECLLIEPLNGILQKNSTVHFRCQIPRARKVLVSVDGKWIKNDTQWTPDETDMFDGDIQVGKVEVIIFAKFDKKSCVYSGLLKYNVS